VFGRIGWVHAFLCVALLRCPAEVVLVGRDVLLKPGWDAKAAWSSAVVTDYDADTELHDVLFNDGKRSWLRLSCGPAFEDARLPTRQQHDPADYRVRDMTGCAIKTGV
jgi:hypothetical protein